MDTPKDDLARLINRRQEELGLTWDEIATRGGITVRTLIRIRQLDYDTLTAKTKRAVEKGLSWPRRYVDVVLDGNAATTAENDPILTDPIEQQIWALPLPAEQRWHYIHDHRQRQQKEA